MTAADLAIANAIMAAIDIDDDALAEMTTVEAIQSAFASGFLAALRGAGFAVVPRENNDTIRRAVWRAQYEYGAERVGKLHPVHPDAVATLTEEKVSNLDQREQDIVAYRAMVAAAEGGE